MTTYIMRNGEPVDLRAKATRKNKRIELRVKARASN
jgi:hypothetical protein